MTATRTLLALIASLSVASSGCFVITDNAGDPLPPAETAGEESIDPDATIVIDDSELGTGTGLYVEYMSGGGWRLFTTCDTRLTDVACEFDVIVTLDPGALLGAPVLSGGSPENDLTLAGGGFQFYMVTTDDQPTVVFSSDPGAGITVDMLLDGFAQPAYVNWVSGGVHQQDPGVNPVRFTPLFD
jgi:hypothetical protein